MITYIMVYPDGEIVGNGIVQEESFPFVQPLPGTEIIPNKYAEPNSNCYYDFATGEIVQMPQKPDGFYKWDYQTHSWIPDYDAAVSDVIAKRDKLLLDSDWTQLPDVPLTEEQKTAWATYRQELRDIPQQSGYPFDVIWPTAPQ